MRCDEQNVGIVCCFLMVGKVSTSDDGTAVDSCWLNLVLLQLAGRFYDAQLVSMKVKLMQFLPYYLEYILSTVYTAV